MPLFSTEERLVYPFQQRDGSVRYIDPVLLERELDVRCGGSLDRLLEKVQSEVWEVSGPATDLLAKATCAAFKLGKPFDEKTGEGVLYTEWCAALNGLVEFREKNVSTAANSPTSSRPSGAESAGVGGSTS